MDIFQTRINKEELKYELQNQLELVKLHLVYLFLQGKSKKGSTFVKRKIEEEKKKYLESRQILVDLIDTLYDINDMTIEKDINYMKENCFINIKIEKEMKINP